jgi:hypothetical protein
MEEMSSVPMVFCSFTEGFAAGMDEEVATHVETDLYYWGKILRVKAGTKDYEEQLQQTLDRIICKEIPDLVDGTLKPEGAVYSGEPVEVSLTFEVGTGDVIAACRVPFKLLVS